MKTPYLNELIEKLNIYKQQDKLEEKGLMGLSELIAIKKALSKSHNKIPKVITNEKAKEYFCSIGAGSCKFRQSNNECNNLRGCPYKKCG